MQEKFSRLRQKHIVFNSAMIVPRMQRGKIRDACVISLRNGKVL